MRTLYLNPNHNFAKAITLIATAKLEDEALETFNDLDALYNEVHNKSVLEDLNDKGTLETTLNLINNNNINIQLTEYTGEDTLNARTIIEAATSTDSIVIQDHEQELLTIAAIDCTTFEFIDKQFNLV